LGHQNDPAWNDAREVEEPDEEGYYRAIEKGIAKDDEQMKSLRILAWWRRNDAFRDATSSEREAELDPARGIFMPLPICSTKRTTTIAS
jgi:hypothetical protein